MDINNFKEFFEQAGTAFVAVDTDFTIVAVSDSYLKITKTVREHIVGRNIFDVFPSNPNDATADGTHSIRASFNRVLKNKTTDTIAAIKYDIPRPESDGGGFIEKFWKPTHSPVFDEHRSVKYIIQNVEDVTENKTLIDLLEIEKSALRKIEESENRTNMLFVQSPFAFSIMKGKDLVITVANDLMKEFWGKGEHVEGKTLLEVLPELEDQPFPDMIMSVFVTGLPVYANEILARLQRNGVMEDLYFNIVYQPHHEADGAISGVTTIAYEVTELVFARMKAEESEHRFRMLIEEATVATALFLGPEIRVHYANDLMLKYWGKDKSVLDKPLIEALPELAGQPFLGYLNEVYATGIPYVGIEDKADIEVNGTLQAFYFNFTYKALRDRAGTIYGIHLMAIDATDEVLVKNALRESEAKFRHLADLMPQKVWTADAEGSLNYFNECWLEYTGLSHKELEGSGWEDVIHPEDRKESIKQWKNSLVTGNNYETEHRFRNTEGMYKWHLSRGLPYRDSNGSVMMWVGTNTEINEQKTLQGELEKAVAERTKELLEANNELAIQNREKEIRAAELLVANKELIIQSEEKEHRASELIISNHELTYQSGEKGKRAAELAIANNELAYQNLEKEKRAADLLIANNELIFQNQEKEKRAAELIIANKELIFQSEEKEKRAAELIIANKELIFQSKEKGKRAAELAVANKELAFQNREKEQRARELAIANKELAFQNQEKEKRAEELVIANRELAHQSEEKESQATELIVSNKELHSKSEEKERRVAELLAENNKLAFQNREKEKRAAELIAANKELQLFVHISSHDLQEPLRKLQIASSRIVGGDYDAISVNGKEQFKRMKDAAQSMQTLIEDILSYAGTNKEEAKIGDADLKSIIAEVSSEFKEILAEKSATIDTTELCEVNVIPFHFRQLVRNLLSNSLKFSDPGKPLRIVIKSNNITSSRPNSTGLIPGTEYCHISFADNGIGFENSYNEKIFEVFQRLHGKEKYKGTGMGLAIVKKIVESKNGIITAKGKLHEGATFDIYIPAH